MPSMPSRIELPAPRYVPLNAFVARCQQPCSSQIRTVPIPPPGVLLVGRSTAQLSVAESPSSSRFPLPRNSRGSAINSARSHKAQARRLEGRELFPHHRSRGVLYRPFYEDYHDRVPAYRRTFPYEKGLWKRRVCTAGVAVGFVHEPGDDLDLLRIPRGVDHHHVLRYVAHTGHGVLLGPALP